MSNMATPLPTEHPSPKRADFASWSDWTLALARWVLEREDADDMSAGRLACVFYVVEYEGKKEGAASPAEGPTPQEDEWGKVYVVEVLESKDPLVKLANSIVYHFAITKADLYQNENYVKAVRHVAERIRASGPKHSPRCPKCKHEGVTFQYRVMNEDYGVCRQIACGYRGKVDEFFTPSAGEPQP